MKEKKDKKGKRINSLGLSVFGLLSSFFFLIFCFSCDSLMLPRLEQNFEEDKGGLILLINSKGETKARSIVPVANDFDYSFVIKDNSNNTVFNSETDAMPDPGDPISLEKGAYTVFVTGKSGTVTVAEGSETFTIIKGQTISVSVYPEPVAGDDGTFAFNLNNLKVDGNNNSTVTITVIKIKDSNGNDVESFSYTAASSKNLNPGIYTVTITFNNGSKTVDWIETLFIFSGKTSSFAPVFDLDLFTAGTVKDAAINKIIAQINGDSSGLSESLFILADIDLGISVDFELLIEKIKEVKGTFLPVTALNIEDLLDAALAEYAKGSPKLLIIYAATIGNNNNDSAGFERSLIELYNNTNAVINFDTDDYYLHIGNNTEWVYVLKLEGQVPSKKSFLIVDNSLPKVSGTNFNETPRAVLPSADMNMQYALPNGNYAVAVMKNQSTITGNPFGNSALELDYVDMVGIGSSVFAFEGTRVTAQSRPRVPRRNSLVDTNNNAFDFTDVDYRSFASHPEGQVGYPQGFPVELYRIWPRNSSMESWNPLTGLPRVDPSIPVKFGSPIFSVDSGLYASAFSLTITEASGADIYYTTDGSIPVPGKTGTTKYTSSINVASRIGSANVLATNTNSENFYMNPGDPRGDLPSVYRPTANQVPKGTVIRAAAIDEDGKKSEVITKTYFVGTEAQLFGTQPVRILSIAAEPDDLVSDEYGIMVKGGTANRWFEEDGPLYNYRQRGAEWGRAAAFELFDSNTGTRSKLLSTNVEIRIRGGYSRGYGQKSLNVYFRSPADLNGIRSGAGLSGINNFQRSNYSFDLMPGAVKADGTPIGTVKSFMLRSGGNDYEFTKFMDVFNHTILRDRNFTTQTASPVIVYINGEYWGPYNMQERYSDNFLEYKYGIDRNLIISIDNGDLDDGNPGEDEEYWDLVRGMIAAPGTFRKDRFDIDNFADYWAAQIYIYNEDWPHNNYIVWKTRTAVPGNPRGDTKWRFSLHDTEFSMGLYDGGRITGQKNKDVFDFVFNEPQKASYGNGLLHKELIKKLLGPDGDTEFKEKFVNAVLRLYNVNYHPDNYTTILDNYASIYSPLMGPNNTTTIPSYHARWGTTWKSLSTRVTEVKKYLTDIRPAMIGYLPTYISGVTEGDIRQVTISSQGTTVPLKINNDIDVSSGWSGSFYKTVTVTAPAAPSGYRFNGWTVNRGTAADPSALTTTVTFTGTGNVTVTANYIAN